MAWIGYAMIAIAAIWMLYKMYVSFNSAGGTDFMVPVYDAAVYPPVITCVGIYLVLRAQESSWPFWWYLISWLVLTGLVAGAIRLLEELGDRPLD